MRIVVCLKQIPDPETPLQDFHVDAGGHVAFAGAAKLVMDSYAENALEVGLQLRERHGGTVTALCIGDETADEVLRRAAAMTADEVVRVWAPDWTEQSDAPAVAHILAAAIRKLGGADVTLCGRQSADLERGLVGPMLAEELGAACITVATRAEPVGESLRIEQEVEEGLLVVASRLPAVLTVTSAHSNTPRLPRVKDLLAARRRQITLLDPGDLALDQGRLRPVLRVAQVEVPVVEARCEMLTGASGEEQAQALVDRLRAMKAL